jgi:hypothetical protein
MSYKLPFSSSIISYKEDDMINEPGWILFPNTFLVIPITRIVSNAPVGKFLIIPSYVFCSYEK